MTTEKKMKALFHRDVNLNWVEERKISSSCDKLCLKCKIDSKMTRHSGR